MTDNQFNRVNNVIRLSGFAPIAWRVVNLLYLVNNSVTMPATVVVARHWIFALKNNTAKPQIPISHEPILHHIAGDWQDIHSYHPVASALANGCQCAGRTANRIVREHHLPGPRLETGEGNA